MEFEKVQKGILNIVSENVKRLAELFPSAVRDGQIDFDTLKSELGEFVSVSDKAAERYELGWAGKDDAKRVTNTDVVGRTLKYLPEDSKNVSDTDNLYIEGDNLEVLKLLRNSYFNKIKMIYIDPPYNTGNDFVYNDNFTKDIKASEVEEGDVSINGERYIVNQKSNGKYHSNWLSMMYPRLKVAKDLLTDNGAIFISIDDNEVHNLRKICDEIFGEENFFSEVIIQSNKRGQTYKQISKTHEYLIIYTKSPEVEFNELEKEGEGDDLNLEDSISKFNIRELRNRNPKFGRFNRPNLFYPIYVNTEVTDKDGFSPVSLEQNQDYCVEVLPYNSIGVESCWRWGKLLASQNINSETLKSNLVSKVKGDGKYNIYEKYRKSTYKPKSIWQETEVITEKGTLELGKLGLSKYFDFPKPIQLIKKAIKIGSNQDDIILDFFSGSATTAHAVMQLNADDGGTRKYIMVQLPELCDEKSEAYKAGYKNICEIGKERICRAGEKIKEENKDKEGIENLDVGFKVFRTADTNIRWFSEAIKSDNFTIEEGMMSDKDILDFNLGYTDIDVVYEILLRHRDIPLSTSVEKLSSIGGRTYIFADTVVVCLEENVTETIIDKIAAIEPMPIKVIFRDSAFEDDISLKTNSMLRLEAQMKKNSRIEKKAYRVEFI